MKPGTQGRLHGHDLSYACGDLAKQPRLPLPDGCVHRTGGAKEHRLIRCPANRLVTVDGHRYPEQIPGSRGSWSRHILLDPDAALPVVHHHPANAIVKLGIGIVRGTDYKESITDGHVVPELVFIGKPSGVGSVCCKLKRSPVRR